MQLQILKTKAELAGVRAKSESLALVPTMGALHEGHLILLREARKHADKVMAYIFVNPRQFGPTEDFDRYPRPFEEDVRKLEAEGIEYLYAPDTQDVYPPGYGTTVSVGRLGEMLEGAHRPGFFDGVATVLAKMFIRIRPDVALFGEKDYQQLQVVKRMVSDMDLPVKIIGVPTVREKLALSSRNAYLSAGERIIAPTLYETLCEAAQALKNGAGAGILEGAKEKLLAAGFAKIDYLALCDAQTLEPLEKADRPARLLAAAWLGKTRLIDNIEVL